MSLALLLCALLPLVGRATGKAPPKEGRYALQNVKLPSVHLRHCQQVAYLSQVTKPVEDFVWEVVPALNGEKTSVSFQVTTPGFTQNHVGPFPQPGDTAESGVHMGATVVGAKLPNNDEVTNDDLSWAVLPGECNPSLYTFVSRSSSKLLKGGVMAVPYRLTAAACGNEYESPATDVFIVPPGSLDSAEAATFGLVPADSISSPPTLSCELSWGFDFILYAGVLLLAYFFGGAAYKIGVKKANTKDPKKLMLHPQLAELPGLVKDGLAFARGGGGRVRTQYKVVTTEAQATFSVEVGQRVEYLSASKGQWIAAKVKRLNKNGSVDLDLKKGVDAKLVRAGRDGAKAVKEQKFKDKSKDKAKEKKLKEKLAKEKERAKKLKSSPPPKAQRHADAESEEEDDDGSGRPRKARWVHVAAGEQVV